MEPNQDLLLEIWREVCKHVELHDSLATITRAIAKAMPVATLFVRQFDANAPAITTVAIGHRTATSNQFEASTKLTTVSFKRIKAWGGAGEIIYSRNAPRTGNLAIMVPPEVKTDVIAVPLLSADQFTGVLVIVAAVGKVFGETHRHLADSLREPLSAALENDRRLHELAALREAAEADRRSLLTRVGRQEMSEEIVGVASGLRSVMERVALVSRSEVPVLILGETGTGKEVISRAIHKGSPRNAGPFIRVNCGAIPTELIDSQLFGHEKGSFTGAAEMRRGWFERADGGTLFLDEIGELPLAVQVRLLRVLQDGFVERVGGETPIHVDVRIVAATHRDLPAMVAEKSFREDLWYRINIFPIVLPGLRDRIDDIPPLTRHFAQRAANRFGLPYVEPTTADLRLLEAYHWPGNIRELGAVIDRAAILGEGASLDVKTALGGTIAITELTPVKPELVPLALQMSQATLAASPSLATGTLDDAMKQHIENALTLKRGQIEGRGGVAEMLGINPHTLRARMRKLKINWSQFREL